MPTSSAYIVQLPAFNTPAATAFHQQVQAALPSGFRADTSGSSAGLVHVTAYDAANTLAGTYCDDAATVLAQIEAQRASLINR